jgi:hypothetical protein
MLVGNILLVTPREVWERFALFAAVGVFHFVFRRSFLLVSFDRDEEVHRHAPLVTALRYGKRSRHAAIRVGLMLVFTEVGTLELWCEARETDHRWRLQFNLRAIELADDADESPAEGETAPDQVVIPDESVAAAERMIRGVASTQLSPDVLAQLVSRTDGIPLFIEELTTSVVDVAAHSPPSAIAVPATLQEALTARLDRVTPVREVLQVAALLGRIFDADVLQAATGMTSVDVERALTDLITAGLTYRRPHHGGQTFEFKHALIQEAALNTLVRQRRAFLHGRIAEALPIGGAKPSMDWK